ncbi:hypothetical protein HMPREF3217_00433 [Finegoldia magna]|nr:hypothetical protein HMPREF3217_00433 [Finegoldia magna]
MKKFQEKQLIAEDRQENKIIKFVFLRKNCNIIHKNIINANFILKF